MGDPFTENELSVAKVIRGRDVKEVQGFGSPGTH